MRYWLMKSEPDEFSIDDLVKAKGQTTPWFGVRNYQARNFMRQMQGGDRAFFYHSSCPEPGIAGIVEVSRLAYPDASQFDPKSPYYDAKSTREAPRWDNVEVKLVRKTRLRARPGVGGGPGPGGPGRPPPRPRGSWSRSSRPTSRANESARLVDAGLSVRALRPA